MDRLSALNDYIDFYKKIDETLEIKNKEAFHKNFAELIKEMAKTKDIGKKRSMLFMFLYLNTNKKDFENERG